MSDSVQYSFTVLRYLHDVVAGESLNVGVVMYVPAESRLLIRTQKRTGRLKRAFPDLKRSAYLSMMKNMERGFSTASDELARTPDLGQDLDALRLAHRVLPREECSLQWSQVGWGRGRDARQALDSLFGMFVTHHDQPPDEAACRRAEEGIRRRFLSKLGAAGADVPFERKRVQGRLDEITFKTAWKNGRWHAYEPVSLDLASDQDIKDKVRRWRGHLSAVADGASDEVSLHFLVGRPEDAALAPACETAKKILADSPFTDEVVDEDATDRLVESIKAEYLASVEHRDGVS